MTKKQLILLSALVLVGVYLYYFTDWYGSGDIQIIHSIRPQSSARRLRGHTIDPNRAGNTVSFTLNRKYRLTELKVFVAAEVATNKYAHPVWHLVSNSKSAPAKAFFYGSSIRGMRPKVPNAEPDPLKPNVTYRLLLQADALKAEHDFKTIARK